MVMKQGFVKRVKKLDVNNRSIKQPPPTANPDWCREQYKQGACFVPKLSLVHSPLFLPHNQKKTPDQTHSRRKCRANQVADCTFSSTGMHGRPATSFSRMGNHFFCSTSLMTSRKNWYGMRILRLKSLASLDPGSCRPVSPSIRHQNDAL